MNIYALKGHQVRCDNLSNDYEYRLEIARQHLEIGKEYLVEKTEVGSSHTEVFLQEFPGVGFNSSLFEDVQEQPEAQDAMHPDFEKYN